MARIVRLTERDLTKLVKRVIKEENKEDKMKSITINDIFEEVKYALNELGEYDDSMESKAMELADKIMSDFEYTLSYSRNFNFDFDEDLYNILEDN